MDRRLLQYYELELSHLRKMGVEFAAQFPKMARRLSLEEFDCADPYVERLLEGFAFLAARIHLKFDSEFPRFTQGMLESVYPHYLAPTPSMAVVQFAPDLEKGDLKAGYRIPRGAVLRTPAVGRASTPCQYHTAHDVTLWPLEIVEARYHARDLETLNLPAEAGARAALRVRLRTRPPGSVPFPALKIQDLALHLRGSGDLKMRLYEQVFANAGPLVVAPATTAPGSAGARVAVRPPHVLRDWRRAIGFDDEYALLPFDARSFQGYRLLKEYFSLPDRFLFVGLEGLGPAVSRFETDTLDFTIALRSADLSLEDRVTADNFALFCTPAVNLFRREADRIHLSDRSPEYQVIPDRTRPLDFEVYQVRSVHGLGGSALEEQEFAPFYARRDVHADGARDGGRGGEGPSAYFAVHRVPRTSSEQETRFGRRSTYPGSEVYVSLVDAATAPFNSGLRQLAVDTLCTNRDLPLHLAAPGRADETDLIVEGGGPVKAVKWVSGPTAPKPSWAEGEASWRLISHLCLNYLSLSDSDRDPPAATGAGPSGAPAGAHALRELLRLYADSGEPQLRRQVQGVRSVQATPVTRRLPTPGRIAFARGLEVTLLLEDVAFEGSGVFLLAAVLERFFARYVSINSFTETVLRTTDRGEVMRWPPSMGRKNIL